MTVPPVRPWTAVSARGLGLVIMLVLGWQVAARGITSAAPGFLLAILDGANFVFHEGGHILFLFLGQFIHALGGSLTQVAIPIACAIHFWRHRQPAAAPAALFWAGESVTQVAIYVADGRAMSLPLHGGPGVIHDWNYLLTRMGLVEWSVGLGRAAFALGLALVAGALGLLGLDLLRVLTSEEAAGPS